jgi:hypothetical protein
MAHTKHADKRPQNKTKQKRSLGRRSSAMFRRAGWQLPTFRDNVSTWTSKGHVFQKCLKQVDAYS